MNELKWVPFLLINFNKKREGVFSNWEETLIMYFYSNRGHIFEEMLYELRRLFL